MAAAEIAYRINNGETLDASQIIAAAKENGFDESQGFQIVGLVSQFLF